MKILVDLNRKERITMVMVTHDVALKTFAHRVVRMADGKVHKIQEIPHEARQEVIDQLENRVAAIMSGDNTGALTVREGTQQIENLSSGESKERGIPLNFQAVVDPNNA